MRGEENIKNTTRVSVEQEIGCEQVAGIEHEDGFVVWLISVQKEQSAPHHSIVGENGCLWICSECKFLINRKQKQNTLPHNTKCNNSREI